MLCRLLSGEGKFIYTKDVRLFKINDQIFAGSSSKKALPVKVRWTRPVTGKGKEISFINNGKEYLIIDGLHDLDPLSRAIAEDELEKSYFLPRINTILRTEVFQGNRYFDVITDRGKCRFVIKNPFTSIRKISEQGLLIRDVVGNQFIIEDLRVLDDKSRGELEKIC